MNWIDKLEKRFAGWAIPNLTVYLLVLQSLGTALLVSGRNTLFDLVLVGGLVQGGQWWRLFSFMMIPPTTQLIWLFFAFYIFFLMGTALEEHWGAFRYNLYILIAWLATAVMAFMGPGSVMTNQFICGSVFLAFAYLYPDFVLHLFFVLPVKIKWLAMITWLFYGFSFITGGPGVKLSIVASVVNFLIFFGKDILLRIKARHRRIKYQVEQNKMAEKPFHTCFVCGKTDKSHPTEEFRYCSICKRCFCSKHLKTHRHDD